MANKMIPLSHSSVGNLEKNLMSDKLINTSLFYLDKI
jgi:hypothetical protein